ncbi:cell division protein FtsA [Aquifex aeolicus]|uniref:Cell division protein FtsA n=1 Tax=Aquifex aeolicus (strain VF5) TaxID=224324 RepID=O66808_AQUAE|nr:cell division protein FtsA [Aquifex aeolicus]AAC06770.1 cell division protein FtsA [Aquifex aeolicus VF5]
MKRLAALDIGSQKTVFVIGERDSYGDIHIIGFGEVPSRGIVKGVINDLSEAKGSILRAMKEAEAMAGLKVREVVYNVSGGTTKNGTVKSQNVKDTISISTKSSEIEESHIQRLHERCLMKAKEEGYEIVYTAPRKYILDDHTEVKNPLGLVGSKLSVEMHVVKVSTTILRNLEKAIREVGLNPVGRTVNAIASADSVLTHDEKEDGVLLLDMGAGLTDYSLYTEGRPYITGVVPFGGINITKDLSYMLKIDTETAESVKVNHGVAFESLVDDEDVVKIKPRGEDREIPIQKKQVAEIIQSRVEEIVEKVFKEIKARGVPLNQINSGIVVTGGTANLKGIRELIEHMTGLPVRIGLPQGIVGLREKIENPKYATVCGLLRQAFVSGTIDITESTNSNTGNFFKNLSERFKKWFEELL